MSYICDVHNWKRGVTPCPGCMEEIGVMRATEKTVAELRAELEAAREKLNKYGHHLPDFRCGRVYFDGVPCTCGFEEALQSPKEPK